MHQEGQPTQVVNNRLYVAAAYGTNDLETTTTLDVYDPMEDSWTTTPTPTPFNASHMQSATDGRFIFMIAGLYIFYRQTCINFTLTAQLNLHTGFRGKHPGPTTRLCYRYDTLNDSYTALPDLPENRASGAVFLDHKKMLHYVGGLVDRLADSNKHWILNTASPSEGWKEAEQMPMPRNHLQAVFMGDTAYLPGGQFGHDNNPRDQALFHAFNVTSNSWERLPDLPRARSHAEPATFVANGRLIIMGGRYDAYPRHDDIIEYNPAKKTWATLGKLPTGLHINPSVGYFRGLRMPDEKNSTNFVILTAGGKDWNDGQLTTWYAPVSFSCNDTRDPDLIDERPPPPPATPSAPPQAPPVPSQPPPQSPQSLPPVRMPPMTEVARSSPD
jgi:hypothetical protein